MESIHSDIVSELASWFYSQSVQILFWPLQVIYRMKNIKNIRVTKTICRSQNVVYVKYLSQTVKVSDITQL
jgi:hypothetical protein